LSKGGAENAHILAALERLARLMRAGEHGSGLNPAQWEALRYLSRANRFSNSPVALARFLGSTKGTVSQTIKALERKGHILKTAREGEKRSIALALTDKGREALQIDPRAAGEDGAAAGQGPGRIAGGGARAGQAAGLRRLRHVPEFQRRKRRLQLRAVRGRAV
jgi:DNA-binding MarR family transcriptional regulator